MASKKRNFIGSKQKARRGRRQMRGIQRVYWLTPKAFKFSCSHCGADHSVAVRTGKNWKAACQGCVDRLAIKTSESKALEEAGGKMNPVTVTFVDPATLREEKV